VAKKKKILRYPKAPMEQVTGYAGGKPLDEVMLESSAAAPLHLVYENPEHGVWLYNDNCLAVMDAIAEKYPEGRFDMIFADPPYFLSNGGITCHAGKMVSVHKGEWDKSQGAEENHNFNREWLKRCQKVLKPNGTLWVTGTHHVIFSVGYAIQQLGFKILNDIAWEKPNPPPNLSCRYFTHSTETIIWAAKNEKSKHLFNYQAMRQVNGGKQMKTVWTMTAPGRDEKKFGKHPTQKPLSLLERCILASTKENDYVLDPFSGAGSTALAALKNKRKAVGIELEEKWVKLAYERIQNEISVNPCGGGCYVNDAFSSTRNPPSLHWGRPARDSRKIQSSCFREWQQEQGLGRARFGKMHQHRSKLPASPQWFGLGIEDNLFAIAE
jgi:site-specific DNA-methyltransferase (adenine-specific)